MRIAFGSSPGAAPGALHSVAAPKQRRSERTLRRLLDAGEALIEEKGLADVSVPDIVRRAGSSVGGFYARFRDKNELLRALEERFFGELLARVDALAEPTRWAHAALPERSPETRTGVMMPRRKPSENASSTCDCLRQGPSTRASNCPFGPLTVTFSS